MSNSCKLTVSAGEHDRLRCPVSVDVPMVYNADEPSALQLDGQPVPCQAEKCEKGTRLTWLVHKLKAAASKTYVLKPRGKSVSRLGVSVEDIAESGRVDVTMGVQLFTSYHYGRNWARPFLYPVIGPYGAQVTRNWPIDGKVKGEHRDHKHHKSIWVAYGECEDVDNWSEEEGHGWQRHQGFSELVSGPVFGTIAARNDWCVKDGTKQFEEARKLKFYALSGGDRLFDVEVTFNMTEKKVTFHDTKEGGLVSVRVASSMDVRNGGRIENGYGGINENETWGKKAPWCDYSGMVDGGPSPAKARADAVHVGIAVLDHELNPRYPTEWHVRDYGLMTANCFAWKYYRPEVKQVGDMTFDKGSTTTWRYRVYIHRGDAATGKVAGQFFNFIAPPAVVFE